MPLSRNRPAAPGQPALKAREIEILELLAEGMSDKGIATRLSIAPGTVRWYNKELYLKLGVNSRAQAVRRADALGLLDLPIGAAPTSALRASAHGAHGRSAPRTPVRYVERGGVYIAYQVVGDGPVDVLFIHGFISHLDTAWEDPEYTAFFEQLGRVARVILFDKRGVGLSDRIRGAPTLEETIGDACAVMDAVRSTRAFVMGTSEGGAASVLLAMQQPQRVRGLILFGATACVARGGAAPEWARPVDEFNRGIHALRDTWGQPWALERFAPTRIGDARFADWWSRVMRAASSPSAVCSVMEVARDVDIRELLPQVRTRTLVVHRTDDRVVLVGAGRYLAERMPNAHFVEIPGADHFFFVDGEPVVRAVAEFIATPDGEQVVESWLAVILHAGGRGSRLTADRRVAVEGLRPRHLRVTRQGWTALFDTPSRALACARRVRDLARGHAGSMALHIGECRATDGVPIGIAGEVARQLVDLAEPGEVIISETLHDVLVGSGVPLERFFPRRTSSGGRVPFGWRLVD